MKKILVPTDFSQCASYAQDLAINLAKRNGSTIDFLHVVDTPVDWKKLSKTKEKNFPEMLAKLRDAKSELSKLIAKSKKAGVKAQGFLEYNDVLGKILEHLENYNIDFVLIGSHGSSGFKELLLGSTAQKVVRLAKTPVLVVKNKVGKSTFRNVLFASEFGKKSVQPYNSLLTFLKGTKAKIDLVYVNTPANFRESKEIQQRIRNLHLPPNSKEKIIIENALSPERGILNYSERNNCDLIVTSTRGRRGLNRYLGFSSTETVVNHSDKPVLNI